jgi:sulfur-oxidizing protein SoxZ
MLVRHPMDVGGRRKNGDLVTPHFIKEITCKHNGEIVMQGHWGAGIARNPYLSFIVGNAQVGDELAFSWSDNQGGTDAFETQI